MSKRPGLQTETKEGGQLIFSLYVKQHNITGLKYLGQTQRTNPYHYRGSGTYWLNHIKKHGNDVSTYIIATFDSKEKLKIVGVDYSQAWNVVESNEWANLKEEAGDGGRLSQEQRRKMNANKKGKPLSEEHKRKMSEAQKIAQKGNQNWLGRKHSKESIAKISAAKKGNKNRLGCKHSQETKMKMSESQKKAWFQLRRGVQQ